MIARKGRAHLMGVSNRNRASCSNLPSMTYTFMDGGHQENLIQVGDVSRVRSQTRKQSEDRSQINKLYKLAKTQTAVTVATAQQVNKSPQNCLSKKLRKMYLRRKNVANMVSKWGIVDRGSIAQEQIKRKLTQLLNESISDQKIQELIGNKDEIGIKELLKVLYGGESQTIPNMSIFDPKNRKEQRERFIKDLRGKQIKKKEEIDISKMSDSEINLWFKQLSGGVAKIRWRNSSGMTEDKRSDDVFEQLKSHAKFTDGGAILDNIKTRVDPAKLVDSLNSNGNVSDLFVDPLLREKGRIRPLKRKASLNILTTSEAELKQTNIVSNVFVRMTSKDKGAEFDPMTMLGKNQQKTRMGKTNFPVPQPPSLCRNLGDEKRKIDSDLKLQHQHNKQRYQNKLNRLRQYISNEKQNIQMLQAKEEERNRSNLTRIREQQQAYNYVNFVKNRWE